MANYMESFKYNLRLYLATHTYGNYVLWPFGYAFNVYVSNYMEHQIAGQRFVDAIRYTTGTDYLLGNSADLLYTAYGASGKYFLKKSDASLIILLADDFAVAYANAHLAFTLELTGGGQYGFDFPEERIYDLVRETFLGYRALALYIDEHFD